MPPLSRYASNRLLEAVDPDRCDVRIERSGLVNTGSQAFASQMAPLFNLTDQGQAQFFRHRCSAEMVLVQGDAGCGERRGHTGHSCHRACDAADKGH